MQSELQVIVDDPYLTAYKGFFDRIRQKYQQLLATFEKHEKGLENFSKGYTTYGIHRCGDQIIYKEWAPGAKEIYLFGEFNNWNRFEHPCSKDMFGNWVVSIKDPIKQFSLVKCHVRLANGKYQDRIPAWINYSVQNQNHVFDGVYLEESNYKFQYPNPSWSNTNLKIYECHIGMSGIEGKVHSYKYFTQNIIDRIAESGYNVIQIMAIMEHPYYGSFGYHVSNFFAVSSRYGKPDEFRQLVDYAHSKGIKVLIDLVHAHAATNTNQGINYWDGTDYQYFHSLPKGRHELWDSRIFDFSKYEVIRFLLSNIRYWMTEYNIDGYRFDGVTSMIYQHHGISYGFTGNYNQYFNQSLDIDALVYLMLANKVIKQINPFAISIAEDVSGFPTLCRTIEQGGIGFDFRLTMAIPDMWIKLVKQKQDYEWNMEQIVYQLTNRRWKQKCITYAESHDQALVGDKTLSMWLFDSEIYDNMSVLQQETPKIFRAMALHKMIRLITISLGGEGYLNFMGNQFGHPQWIDFPREGNNWSYHYCRRRWDLLDDHTLRYQFLYNFDKDMLKIQKNSGFQASANTFILSKHQSQKTIVYERGNLLFVFNFHFNNSYENYRIPCRKQSKLRVVLDTDNNKYGGHHRIQSKQYQTQQIQSFGQHNSFLLYLPSRSAIVFEII